MEWNETSEKHAQKGDWTRNSMMMIYNKQDMKDALLYTCIVSDSPKKQVS